MFKTIRSRLFVCYCSLMLIAVFVLFALFFSFQKEALEAQAELSLRSAASNISENFDTEIQEMHTLVQKIIFSEPLKELESNSLYSTTADSLSRQRRLNEVVYSILGPQFPVEQLNIIQQNGNFYSVGSSYNYLADMSEIIADIPWVQAAVEHDTQSFLLSPHQDEWGFSQKTIFSLCKAYSGTFGGQPDRIIEIQKNYSVLNRIVQRALTTAPQDSAVLVLDAQNQLVYPVDYTEDLSGFETFFDHLEQTNQSIGKFRPSPGSREYMAAYTKSHLSGWSVCVYQPEHTLLAPVRQLQKSFVLVGLSLFVAIIFFTLFLSRSLTRPLYALSHAIQHAKPASGDKKLMKMPRYGLMEVDAVSLAFEQNYNQLATSLQKIMDLENLETHSRLLALQSQMNPHFLYNVLANLISMSEETDTPEIATACRCLSDMLRYISTDSPSGIALTEELIHVEKYIHLMKIRYEEQLSFQCQIGEELMPLTIPKLCIQPLVENCIKYALSGPTPWRIDLTGWVDGDHWKICVRDYSCGFPPDVLEELQRHLKQVRETCQHPPLKPGGMGLLNICARLTLCYGKEAIFEVGNCADGGAYTIIGGTL